MRTSLFWYTKDLRVSELPALAQASSRSDVVVPVYIWDDDLLEEEADNKKAFLLDSLTDLDRELRASGSGLSIARGETIAELTRLCNEHDCHYVYCTTAIDPATKRMQQRAAVALDAQGITLHPSHPNFLFDPNEIKTKTGSAYRVFTPFKNAALTSLQVPAPIRTPRNLIQEVDALILPNVMLEHMSPERQEGGSTQARKQWGKFRSDGVAHYDATRNDLANEQGTSKLAAHLNFGTISPNEVVRDLMAYSETLDQAGRISFLNELIWREFNAYIAYHFPEVLHRAFREELSFIEWSGKQEHLDAWKEGLTGYPVVDAAMRQLRQTGWMHNRARMIVSSFLVKDLLINWQEGEAHFMEWLTDGDQLQNNAGWQWSASTGVDAQPYFRIFNPITQGEKFDPTGEYVRRYVPELRQRSTKVIHDVNVVDGLQYPRAIVDHATQRERALAMFKKAMTNFRK